MSEINVKPPKTNRPDGLSIDRYKGHEKWSYRRWAWEFLRRNKDFIAACEELDREEESEREKSEKKIAEKFHLKNFKHYKKAYKSDDSPAPKFIVRTITVKAKPATKKLDKKSLKMTAGQIWVRFDLNHEFVVRGSLAAQLRVAKRSLDVALKEYADTIKKSLPKKKRPARSDFIEYLRRLDAVAAGDINWKAVAEVSPRDFRHLEDSGDTSDKGYSLLRSARLYAEETYLAMAIHAA